MRDGMDKLTLAFVVSMAAVILFSMGADLHNHDYLQLAIGAVIVLFFIGFGVLVISQRVHELKAKIEARDRDIEMMKSAQPQNMIAAAPAQPEIPQAFKDFVDEVITPIVSDARDRKEASDLAHAIYLDVVGDFETKPTEEQIARIEQAYHDQSDGHFVKVNLDEGRFEFSADPFEDPVPGRSEAHEDARRRGDKSRAKAADKPLTKSQQRRINAQKGHGAITDDELREKKNAERRAKRAAKKNGEAATTTTTTTQPGQTSLV